MMMQTCPENKDGPPVNYSTSTEQTVTSRTDWICVLERMSTSNYNA